MSSISLVLAILSWIAAGLAALSLLYQIQLAYTKLRAGSRVSGIWGVGVFASLFMLLLMRVSEQYARDCVLLDDRSRHPS